MPILLTAQELTKSYHARPLFEGLSFVVEAGERVGLIGPNGAGKSTLLKILANEESPDVGEVIRSRGLRWAYVRQDPLFDLSDTVRQCLAGHDALSWENQIKADQLLWSLGLDAAGLKPDTPLSVLSGGWKKRLAIAREILKEPDLLFLDEPTNHLDIEGILWLERLVRDSVFATVTVTHDRSFLQGVSNRILELDRRNPGGILSVAGNYSKYLEMKAQLLEAQKTQEEVLRGVLRRETEWLKAGVKARTTKQQARIHRHGELTSQVQELSERNESRSVTMEFQASAHQPKRLIETKRLTKSYPDRGIIFDNLELYIHPGLRLALMGPNGCGKSTLLRVLLGQEKPDKGHIFWAENLKVAYFEQGGEGLDLKLPLRQAVCPDGDHVFYRRRPMHIRSYLEKFLFRQEQMDLPVGSLSGGEQSRVRLAKLMLIEANVLVLDEPTNDLDIPTLNILEDCLLEFEGAVLLVTHDRFFMDRVVNKVLAFPVHSEAEPRGQLQVFENLEQWTSWFTEQSKAELKKTGNAASQSRKEEIKKPKSSQALIKKIEKLEAEIAALEQECAKPEVNQDMQKLIDYGAKIQGKQEELDRLYKDWEANEA